MQVNTEDITVPWGRAPDPLDIQFGRWRMAVFQDVQESFDKSKLYFLYDPVADERSGTTGGRKGNQGLVIFDLQRRCFTRELPLYCEGSPKYIFALKCPSPSGGSSFVVVTATDRYGQTGLLLFRVNLTQDGMNLESEPRPLLSNSIPVSDAFIIAIREDAPEVVLMTAPGLSVWRMNCLVEQPSSPMESFSVPGADLNHYYDAYLSQGNVYFMSQSPDGHFDPSRIHVLEITGHRQIRTQMCNPDPQRGFPNPRKQAAMDSMSGYILLAGGEIDYGSSVSRLVDYWFLDLSAYTWQQIPAQMPLPLIEPRLTTTNSGCVYLWGDFDQPLPGMPSGTHLRILKVTGFEGMKPPPYDEAIRKPTVPPYTPQGPYPAGSTQAYPDLGFAQPGGDTMQNMAPYPQANNPPYSQQQQQPPYPPAQSSYPQVYLQGQPPQSGAQPYPYPASAPPQQQYGGPGPMAGQHAYYPPQDKQTCSLQ
ncbi:unnamed protein product [Gongylonema pulchrum]|uniref:CUB domain-containing protein n=1 Tax=Gongylonema pulchrum TaxID=637853 RepID=A0A183DUA9_9BILA|nr:unnamed protein product [Gongylonema pulchrum]